MDFFLYTGALSLALAAKLSTTRTPLAAAITCYGIPPPSLCDLSTVAVKTPVQVLFNIAFDNYFYYTSNKVYS